MKRVLILLAAAGVLMFSAMPVFADPITFTGTNGVLDASAAFSVSGGILTIVLTNTSTADVAIPVQVLTGLFFDLSGTPTLTPGSATLTAGSTVFFGPSGGGNVGGEWEYLGSLSGAPNGASYGISSAGLGIFGNPNFGGANLDGPNAVNGLNYGITSAGDNLTTGNAEVTGNVPLIQNSVTFTLAIPVGAGLGDISNVSFQYGTALTDGNVPGGPPPGVPEPTSLLLLGAGLTGVGIAALRRKKQ